MVPDPLRSGMDSDPRNDTRFKVPAPTLFSSGFQDENKREKFRIRKKIKGGAQKSDVLIDP